MTGREFGFGLLLLGVGVLIGQGTRDQGITTRHMTDRLIGGGQAIWNQYGVIDPAEATEASTPVPKLKPDDTEIVEERRGKLS